MTPCNPYRSRMNGEPMLSEFKFTIEVGGRVETFEEAEALARTFLRDDVTVFIGSIEVDRIDTSTFGGDRSHAPGPQTITGWAQPGQRATA